jgi:uncharacterized protein (DUF1330 family)
MLGLKGVQSKRGSDQATEVLEGSWSPERCVIVEFPDMATFNSWWSSPEYLPLRAIRERTANSQLVVTQGL